MPADASPEVASVSPNPPTSPLSQPLVEIERVTKRFGAKTALEGVTLAVPHGQICGLLGPNGAGKTTLCRLLMGILSAVAGHAHGCYSPRARQLWWGWWRKQ